MREVSPVAVTKKEQEYKHELISKEIEYRDAGGNFLGKAEIELGDEEELKTGDDVKMARQLRSLRLVGEKDGKPVRLNLLNVTNKFVSKIYVGGGSIKGGSHEGDTNQIWISSLDTPMDLAVLLHELGHSWQYKENRGEGKFEKIRRVYWMSRKVFKSKKELGVMPPFPFLKSTMEAVSEAIPETAKYLTNEKIVALEKLEAEKDAYMAEWGRIGRTLEISSVDDPRFDGIKAAINEIYKEREKIYASMDIYKILTLPARMMERDAWARALKWLRIIRQRVGIDFFKSLKVPKDALLRPEEQVSCLASAKEALGGQNEEEFKTSIIGEMKNGLGHVEAAKPSDVRL